MQSHLPRPRLEMLCLDERLAPASALDRVPSPNVVFLSETGIANEAAPFGSDIGTWVAASDITGDGIPDLIASPGAGSRPIVRVFDGKTQQQSREFDAYEPTFTGGVFVAAADLTGDGKAEIITGTDQGGGPRVRVVDLSSGGERLLADFFAIEDRDFRGGVRVGLGDVNGDGTADRIVSAGFLGGPRISGFDGQSLARGEPVKLFADFFGFEDTLRNGAYVGVGDVTGDGKGDVILGAGPGGGPRVRVLDGALLLTGVEKTVGNFFAGSAESRGGVRVGAVMTGNGVRVVSITNEANSPGLISDGITGVTIRGLPGRIAGGSGLLSDTTSRDVTGLIKTITDPTIDVINASLRGTYKGIIRRQVGGVVPMTMDNPRGVATVDHEVTVIVTDAKPRGGRALSEVRKGGIQTALYGTITLNLPGIGGFTKPLETSSSVTFDPFPEPSQPTAGLVYLSGNNGPSAPSGVLNQFITMGVLNDALKWTPEGFSGTHFDYQYNYRVDPNGFQNGYSPIKENVSFLIQKVT